MLEVQSPGPFRFAISLLEGLSLVAIESRRLTVKLGLKNFPELVEDPRI